MSRSRKICWRALLGIATLAGLLQAGPGQAQIRCDWCRFVPCPDAAATQCYDAGLNLSNCADQGNCFPIEWLQTSQSSVCAQGSALAKPSWMTPPAATPSR